MVQSFHWEWTFDVYHRLREWPSGPVALLFLSKPVHSREESEPVGALVLVLAYHITDEKAHLGNKFNGRFI